MKRIIVIVLTVSIIVSAAVFTIRNIPFEKKGRHVRNNMMKIKNGATSNEVKSLLHEPDTVYYEDSSVVFSYDLGFLAADRLRIYLRNDTVFNRVSYD